MAKTLAAIYIYIYIYINASHNVIKNKLNIKINLSEKMAGFLRCSLLNCEVNHG